MKRLFVMYGALALGFAGLLPGTGLAQNRPAGDIPGPIDSPGGAAIRAAGAGGAPNIIDLCT